MPAASRIPGRHGFDSVSRTGIRCASRTQVKTGLTSGSPKRSTSLSWLVDTASDALDLPGQGPPVAHQLDPRRVTRLDPLDLGFFEIAVDPE